MPPRATREVGRQIRAAMTRAPDLFAEDARLVVGYSGGQDSTCLLHVLRGRRQDVVAVHVDHGLRPESASEAERIAGLARTMVASVEVVRVDVAAYRANLPRWSLQQAARAARYQALAAVAKKYLARAVMVAHTSDDQAETVLLNLLRGSGLRGLAGMPPDELLPLSALGPPVPGLDVPESVRLARPLLAVSRPTTLAYCVEEGLTIVEDASNQTRAYTRNRVRLDLLPALEQFNPGIRQILSRTADLVAEDLAALDSVVEALHGELAEPVDAGLRYGLDRWRAQPRALQRRLLRRGLARLVGTLVDVRSAPIDDALELLRTGSPDQTYHLPYGVELRLGRGSFVLQLYGRATRRNARNTWGPEVPRV